MRKRLAVLLAIVVLAGCSPVVESAPTVSPSAESTETAPISTAAPLVDRPQQVFGGSCNALATAEELSGLYGAALTPAQDLTAMTASYVVDQAGGLRCGWALEGDEYSQAVVFAVVLPELAVAAADALRCYDGSGCSGDETAGGMRLSFVSGGATNDPDFAKALVGLFRDRSGAAAPAAETPPSGAWSQLTDCDLLSDNVNVGEFFDEPGEWVQEVSGRGYEGTPSAMSELWGTPLNTCDWSNYGDGDDNVPRGFRIDVLGGGGWVYSEIASDEHMTEVTVEGFEHTLIDSSGGGWPIIHFFDGTNWMRTEILVDGEWEIDAALIGQIARAAADVLDRTSAP